MQVKTAFFSVEGYGGLGSEPIQALSGSGFGYLKPNPILILCAFLLHSTLLMLRHQSSHKLTLFTVAAASSPHHYIHKKISVLPKRFKHSPHILKLN